MKVGDMVIRAYAYHAFIPGIIVEMYEEKVVHAGKHTGYYINTIFAVLWSDDTQTTEMAEELSELELYFEKNSDGN